MKTAAVLLWAVLFPAVSHPLSAEGLPHEAYLWQRHWDESVRASLHQARDQLSGVAVLGSEAGWKRDQLQVARARIDYDILRESRLPVSLVLRVGDGPFSGDADATKQLANLAASLVAEAKSARIPLRELQIDFDCAESKLDGYRAWVETIRRTIAPVPLTITALPSWLAHGSFAALARKTDGFVLQVHSLERPAGVRDPMTLCDPKAAQTAVATAARVGVPFRVALPTYGYVVGFDAGGKLLGLSAEGPMLTWPSGTRLRDIRADPPAMARLVRHWTDSRPANLQGILWYRLSTEHDSLVWSWPTLATVMKGGIPRSDVRVEFTQTQPGLVEVELTNQGDADDPLRVQATVDCGAARILAADGLGGFEVVRERAAGVRFRSRPSPTRAWLAPGERKIIGWVRLDQTKEIKAHVRPIPE